MTKERFLEIYDAIHRSLVKTPGAFLSPEDGLNPIRIIKCIKFKIQNYLNEPDYFKACGTLIFCGSQGEGKTLTATTYCNQLIKKYKKCILVSNTKMKGRPFNAYILHRNISSEELDKMYSEVLPERKKAFYLEAAKELEEDFYDMQYPECTVDNYIQAHLPFYYFDLNDDKEQFIQEQEYQLRDILTDEIITTEDIKNGKFKNVTIQYTGLDCLKYVNNGKLGVLFFIDEIHLELNSLESKNVPVEVMTEISQQRKQRKHIVGTSQRYNRMAKPLREQVRDIVACKCFFGCIQYNQLIDGDSTHEVNGELAYDIRRRMLWFHSPEQYKFYDTYAKMKRYNNEWHGRPQVLNLGSDISNE